MGCELASGCTGLANGSPALLIGARVWNGDAERVAEHPDSQFEGDFVLLQVCLGLGRVPRPTQVSLPSIR